MPTNQPRLKNCQDESVLRYPGERTGKTILVRRSQTGKIEAHQWDGMEWQNLGEVLDPLSVKSPDFTFKVELDDTGKSYNLTYNWGESVQRSEELWRGTICLLPIWIKLLILLWKMPEPPANKQWKRFKISGSLKPEMFKVEALQCSWSPRKIEIFRSWRN